jgi:hypothetical protein
MTHQHTYTDRPRAERWGREHRGDRREQGRHEHRRLKDQIREREARGWRDEMDHD